MTRAMHLRAAAAAACLASALAGQTPLTAVRVASGLNQPLFAASPPGDEDRLFVVEQSTGRIRILRDGVVLPAPFLDIGSKLSTTEELGLLGLAFHPQYASNGFFYVKYTRPAAAGNEGVVERYTVSATNRDVADPSSAQTLLVYAQPFGNHNGGCLQFGPADGYLYISTGDGGSANDPFCNGQNRASLLGKILRIDVDAGAPYAIPPSNPFAGVAGLRGEIWSWGLRNPWRFSFDRGTGDRYIADVGQSPPAGREEICFESAASAGGVNFGWKIMQGTACYLTAACANPPPCPPGAGLVRPILEYPTGASCAVIGGYVYRGCAIPDLQGTYFFGDYCSHRTWSFRYDGTTIVDLRERTAELTPAVGTIDSITSFGEDARGELYVCDQDGDVFRIVANAPPAAIDLGFGKVGGNGLVPKFELCGLLGAGQSAQAILRRAPPSTTAALLLSATLQPLVLPFGTIAPGPPIFSVPFVTSPEGRVQFTLLGGLGPITLYMQWAMLDGGATAGLGLSNALAVVWP